jgi:hypothetical protein
MKKYLMIHLILLSFFLISCEEVIDVNLNNSSPKIVIEGKLCHDSSYVKITKTTDYFEPGIYPAVSGAAVTITPQNAAPIILQEISPGRYHSQTISPLQGIEYTLEVTAEGYGYSAKSVMPHFINIDSLSFEEVDKPVDDEDEGNIRLSIHFTDTENIDDYCRLKIFRNGEAEPGSFLYNGRLSDGKSIHFERMPIWYDWGDTAVVELYSIDYDVFNYFNTLSDVTAGNRGNFISTEVPANPETNFSEDALGYFSAHAIDRDTLIIRR